MIEWETTGGVRQRGMPVLGTGLTLAAHSDGRPLLTASGSSLPAGTTGKYLRYGAAAWEASDLLSTDLTGTIASARLSGAYSGITGLGTLGSLAVSGTLNAFNIQQNSVELENIFSALAHTHTGYAATVHYHAGSDITSGSVAVAQGGTGRTSLTQNAVLVGNTTTALQMITGVTAGHVLTWNGSGPPSFQAITTGDPTWTNGLTTYNNYYPRKDTGQSATIAAGWNFTTAPTINSTAISLAGHGHAASAITAGAFSGNFSFTGTVSAVGLSTTGGLSVSGGSGIQCAGITASGTITANGYRVPQVVASTSVASGTYPEGTIWLQYT